MATNYAKPVGKQGTGYPTSLDLAPPTVQSEPEPKPKRTRKPRTIKKKSDVTVKVGDIPTPIMDSHKKDSPHQTRRFRGNQATKQTVH